MSRFREPLRHGQVISPVFDSSQVGEARRTASRLASNAGFNETDIGKIAIIITEAGNNMIKHTSGGEMLFRMMELDQVEGIEILALDNGPGISNVDQALTSRYSDSGGLGIGLGAVQRLSDIFDMYSAPGKGTVILSRLWSKRISERFRSDYLEIGAIFLPKPGEEVSGDTWMADHREDKTTILIVDGLGHGSAAHEAALRAVATFEMNSDMDPVRVTEEIHKDLWNTRGAALAVVEVDLAGEGVRYAGIGNTSGLILSRGRRQNMVSYPGTAGYESPKIAELSYPFPGGSMLILHTDGLGSRWNLEDYPGLASRHPSLIAGVLYRDHTRGNDDVTIVVARRSKELFV